MLGATFALSMAMPAAVQTPAQAATCTGVWVVVDFGSLGGTTTKCATSFSTGTAALKSAGFSPSLDGAMVLKISGKPSSPDINQAYWSYWHASLKSDGSYSDWSYSNLGANAYHPTKGNAEGWRYLSLSDDKVPPAAAPPAVDVPTASPSPTPTATRTSRPTATAKPSPKPTAKPTATRKPTASASSQKPTASATSTPGSATPTTVPTVTPSTAVTSALPAEAPTEPGLQQADGSDEPVPGNSPVGALVATGLVVAGGAGVGGWWLLRGRGR